MNYVAALLHQHQKEPGTVYSGWCTDTHMRKKIGLFTAEKVRPITVHLYTWFAIPNYHNNYSSSCEILIF